MNNSITTYSAGNIVSVTINSQMKITNIDITEDNFNIEQKPLLEEMIASTINEAYQKMKDENSKKQSPTVEQNYAEANNNFTGNIDDMKDMLGNENVKNAMDKIMGNMKVEYKDGKPHISMPMDNMLSSEALSQMMDLLNKK